MYKVCKGKESRLNTSFSFGLLLGTLDLLLEDLVEELGKFVVLSEGRLEGGVEGLLLLVQPLDVLPLAV